MLSLPALASAQQQPITRERVRAMLSGIEHLPSDDDWRRVGDGALPILIELSNDPRQAGFIRIRAIGATGAFPGDATRTFLLAVANAQGQSDLFVREAVNAMARAFGRNAIGDLTPFLSHAEPVVREGTARALGRIGGADATRLLRARLNAERDTIVREAIQAALSR